MTYDKDNRLLTRTTPNGKVVTNTYDWKTGGVSSVLSEINATAADDITMSYAFDANGRTTTVTDGRGNAWAKGYDAMGRMTTLTTPNPGAGAYTHTITYNGNGNKIKTDDFKGTVHYYQYDGLGRMTGHGTTSLANDETYTWACCNELTAFTDAHGTASLSYNDLGRQTSFTDTCTPLGETSSAVVGCPISCPPAHAATGEHKQPAVSIPVGSHAGVMTYPAY